MKLKTILAALVVTLCMTVCSLNSYASSHTYDQTATSGSIAIPATVASTYTITLPATLSLAKTSGSTYEGTYTVKVKANLDKKTYVKVIPASTFTLTCDSGVAAENATASVTQTVKEWRKTAGTNILASNKDADVSTTGKVSVNLPYAGSYSGNLTFTFSSGNIS